ncbi:alpha/beta hydrolase [Georgenia sp. EYE_87]|uniref:alpha/beta fold hydrolase n=1 Tax=Georgenia sp. EYE_87 TaxID=2853448 RepID=UPI002005912A|nr:alpha/beta fold hydrolase [Georgenia sp. EYE_87]MCK6210194.1 alpha/beta hydrolase [Georgenia sp. EYE_87]
MTPRSKGPVHVVLVPGYWLGGWAWDHVVPHLEESGLVPHAVTLPGMASRSEDRAGLTLEDHVRAVRELVEGLDGPVVLVGHSGGAPVVSGVGDAVPERIARVVYVDAGPVPDGSSIGIEVPDDAVDHPLPPWEDLAADDTPHDGMDDAMLARVRERSVPTPAGVVRSVVRLTNERRKRVPVTVVCSTMPAGVLRDAIAQGAPWAGELAGTDVTLVDLPTGHWPMFSRPADLAQVIAAAAR